MPDTEFLETLFSRLKTNTLDLSSVTPRDLLALQCHLLTLKQYTYAKKIANYAKVRAPFTGTLPLEIDQQGKENAESG